MFDHKLICDDLRYLKKWNDNLVFFDFVIIFSNFCIMDWVVRFLKYVSGIFIPKDAKIMVFIFKSFENDQQFDFQMWAAAIKEWEANINNPKIIDIFCVSLSIAGITLSFRKID